MKCRKAVIRVVFTLAVLAVTVGTVLNFSLRLQQILTQETYRTLSEVSVDYNKAFFDRISYNIRTMQVLAGGLQEMSREESLDIKHILQRAVNDGGFIRMAVSDADGHSLTSEGKAADVSRRDYFKKAMQGEVNVSDPLRSMVNGEETIIIAVPIYNRDAVSGALLGVYPLASAGAQLLDFTYFSDGYGFVVTPEGTIVLSSEHEDKLCQERNLFSFFKKTKLVDFSVAEIEETIARGESQNFAFIYNGERRFVSFMPSMVNDWYTFSVASDALMLHQEKTTGQIVLKLVLTLAVVGIALLAWVFVSSRRHNREINRANKNYQSLLANINGGMIVAKHSIVAEETLATYVSSGFTEMTGYTLDDILTLYGGRYLDVLLEEDRRTAFQTYLQQMTASNTYRMPYRIRKKDGSILWVMDNGYLVEDADGLHNHSIITDIGAVKAQEEEMRMSEKRFSLAINASSGTLFEVDLKRQLYTHFENAQRIFGIGPEKLLEETRAFSTLSPAQFVDAITTYFFHPDDYAVTRAAMRDLVANKITSYEARLRRFDDGSYLWARVDLSLSLDENGEPSSLVGFMSDIDAIKKQAERLENQLQADPMTGLYNKIAMATLANKILRDYPDNRHALIIMDIDNFKGINDTLGHAFGDLVLIEFSTKLKTAFRNNDVVGRMGGDEFAILMKNVSDSSSVLKKATSLSAGLRQTYAGEKEDYKITCSLGIIMLEGDGDSFETAYRKADGALYQAKENGKDQFVLYQKSEEESYPIQCHRTNDEELQNLKTSHSIEAQIFELLYTAKDFGISINMALAAIGQQYQVSRVDIFENSEDNASTSVIYEWCNEGVKPAIGNIQDMRIAGIDEPVLASFDQNGLLYCNDVRELPPHLRQLLQAQGVRSTLKVIIMNDDKLCGFIGFDECSQYRVWTSEEIEKLTFLAKVLSVFLFKKKTELALLTNLHTRLTILDTLPDYICVVNPYTHTIEYANWKMQELLPQANHGAFCFTTLRGGQNSPCQTCLMDRIKRGDTDNLEIVSEDKQLHLKIKALTINWTNDQEMVLLYGTQEAKFGEKDCKA